MSPRRSVLMTAFHYPPCAASGTFRTLKFSKYLDDCGWSPTVLTARENLYSARDATLVAEIPSGTRVVRTNAFDSTRHFAIAGKHLAALATPDRFSTWLPFAVAAARPLLAGGEIDLLFTTSPVPTAHLIGLRLKREFRLPWVADFRDPWVTPSRSRAGGARQRLERWLETQVMETADALVVTTGEFRERLLAERPTLDPGKIHVVSNGFDDADFPADAPFAPRDDGRFVLSHVGEIYPDLRNPETFFLALSQAANEVPTLGQQLELRLIGPGPAFLSHAPFQAMLSRLGLTPRLVAVEQADHAGAVRHMLESDALLLFQQSPGASLQIPAKAYEYIRAQRPVLTVAPAGATATLMVDAAKGPVVEPGDVERIKAGILDLYRHHGDWTARVRDSRTSTDRFSRRTLTRQLAGIFDGLLANSGGSRRSGTADWRPGDGGRQLARAAR